MSHAATDAVEILSGAGGNSGGADPPGFGGEGSGPSGAYRVPQRSYVTGMLIALGAVFMFFAALVSASIVHRGLPNSDWRPLHVPRILWLNTLVLLASSLTLVRSQRSVRARDEAGFRHWWYVTGILGLFFLAGQLIAWRQLVAAGVYLATNPSSSFFYLFTAAHGAHLLGGIAALFAVGVRPARHLTRGTAVEVVSLYWHFMDGVWLCLFAFLLMSGGR
jgi:cytochrome c oxidase subunit III